jgi:phage terminase large subunit-like protein
MVRRSPFLSNLCKVVDSQKRIVVPSTGSFYRAIPADAAGAHGFNAHAVIFDEVHAQPNRDLWDVLTTATAARTQPLVFAITTAGFDRTSICYELHNYAERVLKGTVKDPTFFGRLWALPEDADWTDESLWKLANPALDDFRSREELQVAVEQAKERPAMENTVRRLYFSQWTQAETRWFKHGAWDACAGVGHTFEEFKGRKAYGGLDLSSTGDFSACTWVFPPEDEDGVWDVLCRCWLPAETVEKRSQMKDQLYAWQRSGYLEITPGDVIDYAYIEKRILEDCALFDVQEVGFDPWHATQLSVQLSEQGVAMVPVRQGFRTMSAPSKLLETLVANRKLNHGGNPVLRWMADNVVVEMDPYEAIKPSKKKSTERIDLVAALVTSLERASAEEAQPEVTFISFAD